MFRQRSMFRIFVPVTVPSLVAERESWHKRRGLVPACAKRSKRWRISPRSGAWSARPRRAPLRDALFCARRATSPRAPAPLRPRSQRARAPKARAPRGGSARRDARSCGCSSSSCRCSPPPPPSPPRAPSPLCPRERPQRCDPRRGSRPLAPGARRGRPRCASEIAGATPRRRCAAMTA